MNSKTPASVKSIMILYSSLSFRVLCHATETFMNNKSHVLDLTFPGELVSNSALIRVTFLFLVAATFRILE